MGLSGLLTDIPRTTQNPLMPIDAFVDFCVKRFRSAATWNLVDLLREAAETGVLRPLVVYEGHLLYSTFQLWQVDELRYARSVGMAPRKLKEFETVLRLLSIVQDYYLPEVRGNRRYAQWRDYHGLQVLGGAVFQKNLTCLVSNVRQSRADALKSDRLSPRRALDEAGLTTEELAKWQFDIHFDATSIDPLDNWHDLVAAISYDQRQKLKYEALRAQDYYGLVELLRLFCVDAGITSEAPEFSDPTDLSPRDANTELPDWKLEKFGPLPWKPQEQLELIVNEYDLNTRPRAIVITEGGEFEAIADLFRFYKFDPELLGVELRSLYGVGNFTIANWQVFVEYMHEKQVLVFFAIDAEGEGPRQARRLLERQRLFPCEGLKKVIPAEDRIRVWKTSFEEDNFTDAEIAAAFAEAGLAIEPEAVADARQNRGRLGLVEHLQASRPVSVSKPDLCRVLVKNLIVLRGSQPDAPKRPIEEFVEHCGTLAVYNHQPSHISTISMNRATGYFG